MYFYYGVMGSSKTASALMKKFSFEEKNRKVALIKPTLDNRDGKKTVKSRLDMTRIYLNQLLMSIIMLI